MPPYRRAPLLLSGALFARCTIGWIGQPNVSQSVNPRSIARSLDTCSSGKSVEPVTVWASRRLGEAINERNRESRWTMTRSIKAQRRWAARTFPTGRCSTSFPSPCCWPTSPARSGVQPRRAGAAGRRARARGRASAATCSAAARPARARRPLPERAAGSARAAARGARGPARRGRGGERGLGHGGLDRGLRRATSLLQLRPGNAGDRRRRTEPHWSEAPSCASSRSGARAWRGARRRWPASGSATARARCSSTSSAERGRVVALEELLEVFWSAAARAGARTCARRSTRCATGSSRAARATSSSFVIARRGGYELDRDHVWIDADDFETSARQGLRRSPTETTKRRRGAAAARRQPLRRRLPRRRAVRGMGARRARPPARPRRAGPARGGRSAAHRATPTAASRR